VKENVFFFASILFQDFELLASIRSFLWSCPFS